MKQATDVIDGEMQQMRGWTAKAACCGLIFKLFEFVACSIATVLRL